MKCPLCNEEIPDNNDYALVQHFINNHNSEVKQIGKDIVKAEKERKELKRKL